MEYLSKAPRVGTSTKTYRVYNQQLETYLSRDPHKWDARSYSELHTRGGPRWSNWRVPSIPPFTQGHVPQARHAESLDTQGHFAQALP